MKPKDFAKEKKRIKNIKIGTDHRLVRDKWLNIKRIFDAIYKLLSPLEKWKQNETDETYVLGGSPFKKGEQIVSLNPKTLPPGQNVLLASVLEDALKVGVVDYYEDNILMAGDGSMTMTGESYRRFLNGENIIIKNTYDFENYRKKMSELYQFIEKDGRERFPEIYEKKSQNQLKDVPGKNWFSPGKNWFSMENPIIWIIMFIISIIISKIFG